MAEMTKQQKRVYDAIRRLRRAKNDKIGPSRRELCGELGMSPNGVQSHLELLRKKGFVSWDANVARSLDVAEPEGKRAGVGV